MRTGAWPFRVVLAFLTPRPEAAIAAFGADVTRGEHARGSAEAAARLPARRDSPSPHVNGRSGDRGHEGRPRCAVERWNADDWLEVDLDTLRERGKTVGLAAFLDEVEAVVVPLLDPTSREAPGR